MTSLPVDDSLQPEQCAEKLRALAAPERLRIVDFLRGEARCVTQIAAMLQTAPINVSHHLNVLRQAGLVQREKRGRFNMYSLTPGVWQAGESAGAARINLGCCRLVVPAEESQ